MRISCVYMYPHPSLPCAPLPQIAKLWSLPHDTRNTCLGICTASGIWALQTSSNSNSAGCSHSFDSFACGFPLVAGVSASFGFLCPKWVIKRIDLGISEEFRICHHISSTRNTSSFLWNSHEIPVKFFINSFNEPTSGPIWLIISLTIWIWCSLRNIRRRFLLLLLRVKVTEAGVGRFHHYLNVILSSTL
jgi:hypothetical protein